MKKKTGSGGPLLFSTEEGFRGEKASAGKRACTCKLLDEISERRYNSIKRDATRTD
ncbi:hypothetical protein YC2023_017064 [Brassica napus]